MFFAFFASRLSSLSICLFLFIRRYGYSQRSTASFYNENITMVPMSSDSEDVKLFRDIDAANTNENHEDILDFRENIAQGRSQRILQPAEDTSNQHRGSRPGRGRRGGGGRGGERHGKRGVVYIHSMEPHEVAIVQYDSRPLADYWLASAVWNNHYAARHGHKFLYYSLTGDCNIRGTQLAPPWCKVKTMIQATKDHPEVNLFVYMDSDAVVDRHFFNVSIITYVSGIQRVLRWNPSEKPVVFNQDGPSWWCNFIQKVGYRMCLNAGTVMWYRDRAQIGEMVLRSWWESALDSYKGNPIERKFRMNWPWEQDRQMALFNRTPEFIQITSHPELVMMPADPSSRANRGRGAKKLNGEMSLLENSSSSVVPMRVSKRGRNRHGHKRHEREALSTSRRRLDSIVGDAPAGSIGAFSKGMRNSYEKLEGDASFRIAGWCFSHLPGCGCFISHHCANPASKQILRRVYRVPHRRHSSNQRPDTFDFGFKVYQLDVAFDPLDALAS